MTVNVDQDNDSCVRHNNGRRHIILYIHSAHKINYRVKPLLSLIIINQHNRPYFISPKQNKLKKKIKQNRFNTNQRTKNLREEDQLQNLKLVM